MNINEYLQQISLPNEYWTQVDDYNYWVSTRYRAVSSSKKQNAFKLIQVRFHNIPTDISFFLSTKNKEILLVRRIH